MPYKTAWRALHGREGGKARAGLGGLLEKCPAIQKRGRRGEYELQIDRSEYTHQGEIVRKEHFNDDVYTVDLEGLKVWINAREPITLENFSWKARS